MKNNKTLNLLLLLHQPYRVNAVDKIESLVDFKKIFKGIDNVKDGIEMSNQAIFEKVAKNSYIPVLEFFIDLESKNPNFKLNLSVSGTLISQCLEFSRYGSKVLELMKKLFSSSNVEICSEAYYHSLSYFVSPAEFSRQINKHQDILNDLFGIKPVVFRHTENIMDEQIANQLRMLGFKGASMPHLENRFGQLVFEGFGRVRNKVLDNKTNKTLIDANRFDKVAENFVLIPQDVHSSSFLFYIQNFNKDLFLESINEGADHKLLFNDFEALGEHSSINSGALDSFQSIIDTLDQADIKTEFLSQTANRNPNQIFEIKELMATASQNQDIHVWRGNWEQEKCFTELVDLYETITSKFAVEDKNYDFIMDIFGKLSTSDHFFYLNNSSKDAEREVHEMFSPYKSRKDAFESYYSVLTKINKYIKSI